MVAVVVLISVHMCVNFEGKTTYVACDNNVTMNVVAQRNSLSRQLNDLKRQLGDMQCKESKLMTVEEGGYCKRTQHMGADHSLCKVLADFLYHKDVASFGDGTGEYKKILLTTGKIYSYDAFDGGPYSEQESQGAVRYMDLTVPQYGLNMYDWILSIEVAEHIPPEFENIYLDNLFRHAKEGIIMSWAVPGQGGLKHVNNRPLSYVVEKMKENGFLLDHYMSSVMQKASSFEHLKRNIHVFKRNVKVNPTISALLS